jgi:hypothetical protein
MVLAKYQNVSPPWTRLLGPTFARFLRKVVAYNEAVNEASCERFDPRPRHVPLAHEQGQATGNHEPISGYMTR